MSASSIFLFCFRIKHIPTYKIYVVYKTYTYGTKGLGQLMIAKSRTVIKYRSARNESKEMVCSARIEGASNEGLKKRRAQLAQLSNTIREALSKIQRQFR